MKSIGFNESEARVYAVDTSAFPCAIICREGSETVALVGQAANNAILIVEFAKNLREKDGLSIADSAVGAVRLRARAVAMTALCFAVGVIPLMMADGTGKGGQLAIGYASFGGISTATLLGCLMAPVFYVLIQRLRERVKGHKGVESIDTAE